jgi:CMP/dCMP kinase
MKILTDLVIAIDGYSSCGKSTFAKAIAKETNYIYIDSGAMYRAVTLFFMENGLIDHLNKNNEIIVSALENISIDFNINKLSGYSDIILNGQLVENKIRTLAISELVSQVSQFKFVREKMVAVQRKLGENKRVVMDGRDIGTVVFPNADIKIFMTADPHIRAIRRYKEMSSMGIKISLDEIEKNINERDYLDTTRPDSPLKRAPDALLLDNTKLSLDDQMKWFRKIIINFA